MQKNYNKELILKNIIDHNIHFITQIDLHTIEDIEEQHALRLITNAIDVLTGTAIPQIREDVVAASRMMIKTHLMHNRELTAEQREKFEKLAFYI